LIISSGTLSDGGFTISPGSPSASATLTMSGSGALALNETTLPSFTSTTLGGGTISYLGTTQTIANVTYFNLGIAGSNTKTFAGSTTVNGNFGVNGTATMTLPSMSITGDFVTASTSSVNLGSGTVNISGNFTASGSSISGGTSTVNFNAAAAASRP